MNESEVQETLKKIQDDYNNITKKIYNDEMDEDEALIATFDILGRAIILALETLNSNIEELDTRLTAIEKDVKQLKEGEI
jgi:hypothetical protein